MKAKAVAVLLAATLVAVGCTRVNLHRIPQQEQDLLAKCTVGETCKASIGEKVVSRHKGRGYPLYRPVQPIEVPGLKPTPDADFIKQFSSGDSGLALFTSAAYYGGRVGIEVSDTNAIPSGALARQFKGGGKGRTWPLQPTNQPAFRLTGFQSAVPEFMSWELQYAGRDKSIAKFVVRDLTQRFGDVNYSHNLNESREMVFRGVRIRIGDIGTDGVMTYTVLNIYQAE